jgi:hypothetical protein
MIPMQKIPQNNPPDQDGLRLSEDEIQARLSQVRRQTGADDPGLAAQVAGSAVSAGGSLVTGILSLLRIPLLIVGAVAGFLIGNALGANVLIGLVGAVVGFVLVGTMNRTIRNRIEVVRYRTRIR